MYLKLTNSEKLEVVSGSVNTPVPGLQKQARDV